LQEAIYAPKDPLMRGYLKEQLSAIKHISDPVEAQKILLAAVSDNKHVIKPLAGIAHVRVSAPAHQAQASSSFMAKRFVDTNGLVLFTNALAADLIWDKDRTDRFEAAMRDLGLLLGFGSQRPDDDYKDGGPDNLWAIGSLKFLVIECKSGVDNDGRLISKDHCNQLLGAHSWFKRGYDNSCLSTPILVHPNHKFQSEASPSPEMRIIDDGGLKDLRKAIRAFGVAVSKVETFDANEVAKQLDYFSFTAAKVVSKYTRSFAVQGP
jgi:hypothetical protein